MLKAAPRPAGLRAGHLCYRAVIIYTTCTICITTVLVLFMYCIITVHCIITVLHGSCTVLLLLLLLSYCTELFVLRRCGGRWRPPGRRARARP